jgi:hypothetical protein
MIDEAYPEYEVKYLKSEAGPFSVAKFMTLYQAKEYLADLKKNGMNGIILQGPRPVKESWKGDENMNTETKIVDRFDFEQDIFKCWHIVDDIDQVAELVIDRDASKDTISNILIGLSALYGDRFQKLMNNFEELIANGKI